MPDINLASLERRLTTLEHELRKADERIRGFESWRRRLAHRCFLMLGGLTALLVMLYVATPTPGQVAFPGSIILPFTLRGQDPRTAMINFAENNGGGVMTIYKRGSRKPAVALGVLDNGDGGIWIYNTHGGKSFEAGTDPSGRGYAAASTDGVYSWLGYIHGPKK